MDILTEHLSSSSSSTPSEMFDLGRSRGRLQKYEHECDDDRKLMTLAIMGPEFQPILTD